MNGLTLRTLNRTQQTGKTKSLAAIAAREGLAVRYVGRLIRLAFLAPEIVESIMEAGSRSLSPRKRSPDASTFRSHGARREQL